MSEGNVKYEHILLTQDTHVDMSYDWRKEILDYRTCLLLNNTEVALSANCRIRREATIAFETALVAPLVSRKCSLRHDS